MITTDSYEVPARPKWVGRFVAGATSEVVHAGPRDGESSAGYTPFPLVSSRQGRMDHRLATAAKPPTLNAADP